jgi:two-component system sensor kinase FixL
MAVARPASLHYFIMVESSPAAMVLTGGDGVIQFVNAETEHMFGYRSGELVGRSIEMLVPERFRERHTHLRTHFVANPGRRAMGAGRDLTAVRRGGTEFPVEIGLTPIETKTGLVVLATILDISERKKTENAVAQRATELDAAVNGAVDGIIMMDERGVIQWLNPAAASMFGYDSAELVGQNVSALMPEPYAGEHDAYLRRYLSTGKAKIIGVGREVEGRRKNGSTFPIDLGVNVVPIAGKRLFAGFVHDLSERRRLEARMEQFHADRLKAVGGLAAALAHEVNQPLSASATYLKTARRLLQMPPERRPASVEDALDSAADQIMRASGIISNLREFVSRGEPNKIAQGLHELIHDACGLMSGGAKQAGVRVSLELRAMNDNILADGVQIKQVLVNLMRNAIEAMNGCDTRELTITTRLAVDGTIQTDVADTGCGFSKEAERELFVPFNTAKTEGMGVGLSISRSIVEAHYGKIWAESNPGGGAIFRFTLPLAEAEYKQ